MLEHIAYGMLAVSFILMALFLAAVADMRRADDLLQRWEDRLENGDSGVLPAVFHASTNTDEGQRDNG